MAPRKKKPPKTAARKKPAAIIQKQETADETSVEEIAAAEPETEPEQPDREVSMRQHKKFGKFRCLLEEPKQESDDSNLQQETPKTDCEEIEKVDAVEPIVVISLENHMEYTEVPNDEVDLSEQLTQLNVVGEYSVIADGDGEIYLENVESDITVECVAEEIVDEPAVEEVEEDLEEKTEDVEEDEEKPVGGDEVVEIPKKPKKKQTKSKKTLPKSVTSKAKAIKNQLVIEAQNSNSDASSASESSIRRSNRIKSINVLKQKTKPPNATKKILDSDTSENSNSSHVDSEKATPPSDYPPTTTLNHTDDTTKPVKVKSRWRRSSELEMSISSPTVSSGKESQPGDGGGRERGRKGGEDEVALRLRQFVHLKENQYLTERVSCKEAKKMTCDCFLTAEEIEKGESGCGDDCLNRLLMIECGNLCPLGDRCTNKRFQKSQFAPVEVFRTEKKGLGIRASDDIPFGEFILEYVGEVLNPDEFEKRANVYSEDKNQHYYFMSLRSDAVIDATQKGNISRFINHSCDPNAETQKWTVNGELRIGFFSKRTILAGEEITFDYQFQRYGKEAQKCYCETALCRGWLGEEPDEDDDEDEEDEEDEEEEEEEEEEVQPKDVKAKKGGKLEDVKVEPKTEEKEEEPEIEEKPKEKEPPSIDLVIPKEKPKSARVKKERRTIIRRIIKPLRKELFEDPDLDDEIASLISTGLKNQAHTLKLSRLIVRAKEPPQRSKLLKLLRHGEFPCRRLFLDYHGLRLMHGWMTETQQLATENRKYDSLRLELLQTLATLPIPNKTMLQDSKVLATVEKWAVNEKENTDSPADSENNSPKEEPPEQMKEEAPQVLQQEEKKVVDEPQVQQEEKKIEEAEEEVEEEQIFLLDDIFEFNEGMKEIRKSVGMEVENVRPVTLKFPNHNGKKLIEDLLVMFDDGVEYETITASPKKTSKKAASAPPAFNYEVEIVALAVKLLEEWSSLKETFRIPKKERIEQMKEHERAADRKYKALLGVEQESEKKAADRYRYIQRHRVVDVMDRPRRPAKPEDRSSNSSNSRLLFDKMERRKQFAEEERRRQQREQWRLMEKQVNQRYGTEGRGFQYVWNPQTGQWQAVSIAQPSVHPSLPPPTSHYPYPSGVVGQPLVSAPPPPHYPYLPQHPPLPMLPQQSQPPPSVISQIPGQINSQKITLPHTGVIPLNNQPPLPSLPYQDVVKEQEELAQVKFLGPIPPPVKLPPKWKSAKDKYGRPYYYHIKTRISQWEPPEFSKAPAQEVQDDVSDSSSSSTSSLSSDSSSEDSDSDEEIDDTKLLRQIRKKLAATASICDKKLPPLPEKTIEVQIKKELEKFDEPKVEFKSEPTPSPEIIERTVEKRATTIDERLKEQFNLLKDEETAPKKRRAGLVEEIIISPRTEEDKQQFKEDLKRFKENKEKLKRQKALIMEEARKQMKVKAKVAKNVKKQKGNKTKVKEIKDINSEAAKKIKETFRSNMAGIMVNILNAYRKPDCKLGRIQNTDDFKHLARKLTHFVMLKEIKQCDAIEDLTVTESVKIKAKEFVRKYMSKFGAIYQRPKDDVDF